MKTCLLIPQLCAGFEISRSYTLQSSACLGEAVTPRLFHAQRRDTGRWKSSVADEERIHQNTTEKYSYKWPDLAQELNIIRHCLRLLHRGKVAALGTSLELYQIPSRRGPTLRYRCNLFRIPGISERLLTKQL